jgi:putative solute:sodium symporter small subunit
VEEPRSAQSQLAQSQSAQFQSAQPQSAQPQSAQPQSAQRQLVVWRGDQAPVQHDIPGLGDLRDDTNTGRLLIGSLMRAQLGLSLMCLVLTLTVTVSFPVVAALVPAVGRMRVAGLPVTLIVLGFGFYPVFLAIGWFYHRQARQLEARFTDLVEPPR